MTSETRVLLTTLRLNKPQLGLMSVEVLLLCAGGPKTAAELVKYTGASNGMVMRAVWPFITRVTNGERKVIEAQVPLMKRTKKKGRPPLYFLSLNGRKLFRECGLL